ncbi:unnamed protein product, partial [Rotaria magnacalcarata]
MESTKKIKLNDFEKEIQVLHGGNSSDEEADESNLNVSSSFIFESFKEKF